MDAAGMIGAGGRRPVLKAAPLVRPQSAGFFCGGLKMYRLKPLQMLLVLWVIRAEPGSAHDLPFLREWAARFRPALADSRG